MPRLTNKVSMLSKFDFLIASDNKGLYSITFPALRPQSAVIISFGLASLILRAKLSDAKPPKTTE